MLSVAIIVSAMHRPAVVIPTTPAASVDVAKLQANFSRQLNEAVQTAVAESDARHEQRTAQLLAAAAKRFDAERKADMEQVSQSFAILDKYARRDLRAAIQETR